MPVEANRFAKEDRSLARALVNYCGAQITLVSDGLKRRSHVNRGVHEARKGIRRLRSVIALGSPHFRAEATRTDRSLRRLCRSLSQVRDAQVAIDCVRRKAEDAASPEQRALWQRLTSRLVTARTRTMRQARASDPTFGKRQAAIGRIGKSILSLPWIELDPALLRTRLRQSRKRAGTAADRYLDDPRLLHLHRLRRRLRRYRMQIAALNSIVESPAAAHAGRKLDAILGESLNTFERISHRVDQLGELLDTHLLRIAIRRLPASPDRTAGLALLRRKG